MEYTFFISVLILCCTCVASQNRKLILRFDLSISSDCSEEGHILTLESTFTQPVTSTTENQYDGSDTGTHSIDLRNDGSVTFIWTNNPSIFQTCCWSVANARIIEVNNGGKNNFGEVSLGDMCINGTSYECSDDTTWLCSESSVTVELNSNRFFLGSSISSVSVSDYCNNNDNTPSTDPPGQILCNILTPSSSSSVLQSMSTSLTSSTASTSTISSDTSTISSDTLTISATLIIRSDTSTITSGISTITSTSTSTSVISSTPSTSTIGNITSTITSGTSALSSDTLTITATSTISSDTSTITSGTSALSSDTLTITATSTISSEISTISSASTIRRISVISSIPSTSTITSEMSTISSASTIRSTSVLVISSIPSTPTIGSVTSTITSGTSALISDTLTITATSTISSDTSTITSDTSTMTSDISTISTSKISRSFVGTSFSQSPFPSNKLQTCSSDGDLWNETPARSNATGIGACYNGTVNATRRCTLTGEWDPFHCTPSQEFTDTLNMIEESPEDGLNSLLMIINQSSVDSMSISLAQSVFLLEMAYQVQLKKVETSTTFSKTFLEAAVTIISLIDTQDLDEDTGRSMISQFLLILDEFALNLYEPSDKISVTNEFSLMVLEFNEAPTDNVTGISIEGSSITLPPEIFKTEIFQQTRVASFYYQNLSNLLPPRDSSYQLISPVISTITNCESCPITDLEDDVIIQFNIQDVSNDDNISCVFYQFEVQEDNSTTGHWNTSGCYYEISDNIVTCKCNHLTHFAILLSPGAQFSEKNQDILSVIGQVLVPISLICMVLIILTYTCMRSLWSMRNYIHVMLCVNLLIAQLIFIIGIDRTENTMACSSISVILEYMFLVTFMWMLMEGVVLYVALVKIFIHNHKCYIIGFTIVSYAIPLVYMMIIVPIGFLVGVSDIPGHTHYLYYKSDQLIACWLNYNTGFIWSFIVPVIIIIIVNIGFFIMAIVIMRKHEKKLKSKAKLTASRHWLRVSISLTLVMGIAWLANLIVFLKELVAVAYIMTIFIAGQGILLFIILVPLSKHVKEAYLKFWHNKQAQYKFLNKLSFTTNSFLSSNVSNSNNTNKNLNSIDNIMYGGHVMGTFSGEIPNGGITQNMYNLPYNGESSKHIYDMPYNGEYEMPNKEETIKDICDMDQSMNSITTFESSITFEN